MTAPTYGFTFGSLNLLGTDADLPANGYRLTVEGSEDADFGNPVPIEQAVISWLQDGAIVALQGYDNREMYLRVVVDATDGTKLAQGEQALMLETGKANTLTYSPADPAAASSVFDVVMSYLELVPGDGGAFEKSQTRIYGLRIKALPFTRSVDLVTATVSASAGTQSFTTIDDCSSATGWAGGWRLNSGSYSSVTPVAASGRVAVSHTHSDAAASWLKLVRTGLSSSLSGKPYIRIDLTTAMVGGGAPNGLILFTINGTSVPVASQNGANFWLDTSGLGIATVNSVQVEFPYAPINGTVATLSLGDVASSNVLGDQTTARQMMRVVPVPGSARTPASLVISDASAALGSVLVHTMPTRNSIIAPNLRARLASGPTATTDSTTCSGATSDLSNATAHVFELPASGITPGAHLLVARVKSASAGNKTFFYSSSIRPTPSAATVLGDTGSRTLAVGTSYSFLVIDTLHLPSRSVSTNGVIRIVLQETSSGSVTVDDVYIFNIEVGQLTQVECGTGTPTTINRLWLDSPSVAAPMPAIYLGTQADRSDLYRAASEIISWMPPQFQPPQMLVFTVTTNSTASSVTLSSYPRWMTHAVS